MGISSTFFTVYFPTVTKPAKTICWLYGDLHQVHTIKKCLNIIIYWCRQCHWHRWWAEDLKYLKKQKKHFSLKKELSIPFHKPLPLAHPEWLQSGKGTWWHSAAVIGSWNLRPGSTPFPSPGRTVGEEGQMPASLGCTPSFSSPCSSLPVQFQAGNRFL